MENTSTRTPNKRATIKCPHSCTRIRMPRTRTKPIAMFMLWTKPLLSLSHGSSPLRAADLRGNASRYFGNFFLGNSTRSEEHTSELQSQSNIVCRLLLEKKKDL